MNRYSTMKFEIESEFLIGDMADIWVTFGQGKYKITKKKSLGEVTAEEYKCFVTLEQEETALFNAFVPVAVQARWISADGKTDSSTIDYFSLGDVMEEGVMSV